MTQYKLVLSCHNITATSLYNVITTLPTDVCETLISEVQTTPIKRIPGPCDNVVGTSLCFLVKHFGIFTEIKLVFDLPQIASGYFNFVHKTTLLKIPYNVKRERQDRSFDYLISQESRPFLVLKKNTYIYCCICHILLHKVLCKCVCANMKLIFKQMLAFMRYYQTQHEHV